MLPVGAPAPSPAKTRGRFGPEQSLYRRLTWRHMNAVRRLAVASTVATLVLVTIGGLVRATKSGLGCGTDWPHCSGTLVPELENRAVALEFSHRLAAGIVVVLLGALVALAWRHRRASRPVFVGAATAFGLVVWQALLGAVVVKLELEALSVVLHLASAMALLATLVYTTAASYAALDRLNVSADPMVSRGAAWAAGSALLVLMVGSYVSGKDAGLAFGDWPLMDGRLVPNFTLEVNALHFLHRALAALCGALVALVAARAFRRRSELPLAARCAQVAASAFALEVLIGAANVWTRLNSAVVTLHLFTGAVVWASLVALVVVTRPTLAPGRADQPVGRSRPALESSAG
jgi:cytochrome c oxidase assembly protein subunit 15